MLSLNDVSAMLYRSIYRGNGRSIRMADGSKPTTGYMVSLSGYEMRSAMVPTYGMIRAWAGAIVRQSITTNYPLYWGCWFDNGRYYLDVSVNAQDRDNALAVAKRNGQLAIFDVAEGETIKIWGRYLTPGPPRCDADQYPAHVKPH